MSPPIPYIFVDGNNLAYRSFYGVKALTNSEGMPVNAIYGFFSSLLHLKELYNFDRYVVCFDCDRSQKRMELLVDYKANRAPMPDNFKVQIPYIKQMITLWGGLCCEKEGIEADDLLGAWCTWAEQQSLQAAIVSSDKDLMQCVNDYIFQIIPNTLQGWMLYQRNEVFNKMGVYPEQIVDYLSLIGDAADNYPGIEGAGPKTASSWLKTYATLENIFSHINEIKPERFRAKLTQSRDLLQRNRKLATLDRSVVHIQPFLSKIHCLKVENEAFITMLEQLNLRHLAQKFTTYTESYRVSQEEFLF